MSKAIYYNGADINAISAVYDPIGNYDSSWPGMTKTTTATGSFVMGVDHRHHKIVADVITEMSAGEKTSHPLPVVDKTAAQTWKTRVRLATAAALPANTRVGNLFTADVNEALPAIDGVAPAIQDRIFDKDNATGVDRGVKIVTDLGGASSKWKMQRANDSDTTEKVESCETISVAEGTDNKGQVFSLDTPDPIVLNTTALTYTKTAGSIPKIAATGVVTWSAKVSGDTNDRIQIKADGSVSWGPGNAAVNTHMGSPSTGVVAFGAVDGAAAHSVHVYKTRSASGGNYERVKVGWDSNTMKILTQSAGTGSTRGLWVGCFGASGLDLVTNNTPRWNVDGSNGHFLAGVDNLYDQGGPSNRIRSVYWGTQALGPDGLATAGNVTYSFASSTGSGMFLSAANSLGFSVGGVLQVTIQSDVLQLNQVGATLYIGGTRALITTDASHILALKNGANAQTFRVYGTTTGPKYASLSHDGTDGIVDVVGGGIVRFAIGGTQYWSVSTTALVPKVDNAYDLGSTSRLRSVYVGTSISVGTNPAATGAFRLANGGRVSGRNNANDADVRMLNLSSSDNLEVGDSTTGVVLQANGSGKIGLFAVTPVVQPSGTGETTGFVAGSGTGVNDDSTFTGNVGTKAYRINDMVKALKNLGAMAAS